MFRCGTTVVFLAICCHVLPTATEISRQRRIIGGSNYGMFDYPFHASLWYIASNRVHSDLNQAHDCAGTLIRDRWVLTAAHCFHNSSSDGSSVASNWIVYLGMYEQKKAAVEAQHRTIQDIFPWPTYNPRNEDGDIALLKLSVAANLTSPRVSLGNLNTLANCPQRGDNVEVIGWGKTCDTKNSNFPKRGTVTVNETNYCNSTYNDPKILKDFEVSHYTVDDSVLCAGDPIGLVDSCNSDSGGPLLGTCGGQTNVVVGLVSHGIECADPVYPSIYTRVSHYHNWIQNTMNNNP